MQLGANTIISSRKVDVIRGTAEELSRETGRECLAVAADVRNYSSLEEAISKGVARFGRLDYLVCWRSKLSPLASWS